MIGGLVLLVVSLAVVGLAGWNLTNCISRGVANAYGHSYSRAPDPVAFWVSAFCSVGAILLGAALAVAALAGVLGFIG